MNSFQRFDEDDEDDTCLFAAAEEYVLTHHPNPQRIGCPAPSALLAFVDHPGEVALSELNGLHILKCAECTRDLRELRRLRLERLNKSHSSGRASLAEVWRSLHTSISAFVKRFCSAPKRPKADANPVDAPVLGDRTDCTIDLRSEAWANDHTFLPSTTILLPCMALDIHLILPDRSPLGLYHIFVATKDRQLLCEAHAEAIMAIQYARIDLVARLDLCRATPGAHFLGTALPAHQGCRFYSVVLQ